MSELPELGEIRDGWECGLMMYQRGPNYAPGNMRAWFCQLCGGCQVHKDGCQRRDVPPQIEMPLVWMTYTAACPSCTALRQQLERVREIAVAAMPHDPLDVSFGSLEELVSALRQQLATANEHIDHLNAAIRQHVEAASCFQVGGELHDQAKLPLGSSTVVEGIKWLRQQLAQAQQETVQSQASWAMAARTVNAVRKALGCDSDTAALDAIKALQLRAEAAESRLREVTQDKQTLHEIISGLRRGSCWCEVGIGNPMMGGRHSSVCICAQQAEATRDTPTEPTT